MSGHDVGGRRQPQRVAAIGAVVALGLALAACGSSGGEKSHSARVAAGALNRPPVLLGAKNFTEHLVLGQLYAQALRAKGYRVSLKQDMPSTEAIHKALTSGQIDGYAEYTGKLLSAVAHSTAAQPSRRAAHDAVATFEARRGLAVLDETPFENVDAVAVRPGFARQHKLRALGDLKRLLSFTLGGPREFENRLTGLAGMKRVYGITRVTFRPLSIGLQYAALDTRRIQAADVFTTDPALRFGGYTVLADPKHVLGVGHVVPIFNQKVIAAEGPAFARTINAVSARLTTRAMQKLNAAVDVDKESPADAARSFLRANGLG
ncbi:MAG: hypothetical protein LC685_05695 [Actinobacteria bacterium]|nr:hypothetical protein [Actinomycetota bacterium]